MKTPGSRSYRDRNVKILEKNLLCSFFSLVALVFLRKGKLARLLQKVRPSWPKTSDILRPANGVIVFRPRRRRTRT